ncbi:unnamed protein product [Phytophthora fragariaefolia]|uniref:Unnamed protein product n=1 Tax=Phytophthora fragariaefolia TaxID=1490495 RepID=A0A9W6TSJ8_9STRA|nr:unnamed protein product [Phytophthora fragariaefolia]
MTVHTDPESPYSKLTTTPLYSILQIKSEHTDTRVERQVPAHQAHPKLVWPPPSIPRRDWPDRLARVRAGAAVIPASASSPSGRKEEAAVHTKKQQLVPKPKPPPRDDVMTSASTKLHTFERLHAEGFAYLADNSYIRSGYRLHYSVRECFLSLFELHNETLNVWTHMVGSFIFLSLMLYLALSGHALAPAADTAALAGLTTPQVWCGGDQPWMVEGRHAPRMLLAAGLPELCPPPTGRVAPAKYYEVASVIFDHSLHRLPSLQRFHALVEQNVGGFSDSVGAQMELLRSELGALSARLGGQVRDAHSEQVRSLKKQLDQRVESLSMFLQDVASQVGADLPMKYALEELNGVADSVRNGLHILATAEGPHNVPHWPIFAFMASAVVCLTCSATFHLMFVISRPAYMFLSRLDYAGITILIAGSFYPMIYYSFYCHPWLRTAYLVSISTMAAITFVVALMPVFGTPKFLVARTCIFLALGFFGVVPVTHLVWHFGLFDPHVTVMIGPLALMGLLYTSGAIIYATKFPERFYPGRFDLWFSTKMSSSSPSKQEGGSPVAKLQLQLPLALAQEIQSTGRCSFDAQGRFSAFEQALAGEAKMSASPREHDIRRLKPSYRSPRDTGRYPPFATAPAKGAVAARLMLATQAAQLNSSTTRIPYRAPHDHDFREPTSPIKWAPQAKGRDFQTKFGFPSNQDVRRQTARDQDGFFGAAPGEDVLSLPLSPPFRQQLQHQEQLQLATRAQTVHSPPKSPVKPEFHSRVTHSSRKSANKALRLEIILDQEGLLPQLQEIRQHRYRDEVRPGSKVSVVLFPVTNCFVAGCVGRLSFRQRQLFHSLRAFVQRHRFSPCLRTEVTALAVLLRAKF